MAILFVSTLISFCINQYLDLNYKKLCCPNCGIPIQKRELRLHSAYNNIGQIIKRVIDQNSKSISKGNYLRRELISFSNLKGNSEISINKFKCHLNEKDSLSNFTRLQLDSKEVIDNSNSIQFNSNSFSNEDSKMTERKMKNSENQIKSPNIHQNHIDSKGKIHSLLYKGIKEEQIATSIARILL